MNRHERRRAGRKGHHRFYNDYVRHLPRLPLGARHEPGRVYYVGILHDRWCATGSIAGCTCRPIVVKHVEPVRS